MSRRSARAALLVLVLALTAGCTSVVTGQGTNAAPPPGRAPSSAAPPSRRAAAPTQPKAKFTDCAEDYNLGAVGFPAGRLKKLTFQCAAIAVPLDYALPQGKTIMLQLIRIHDRDDPKPDGSLVYNPGGPGAAGVTYSIFLAASLPDAVLQHFDLVGFDPRGVGNSSPITCTTDKQKDELNAASPDVLTPSGLAEAKADAKEVADACNRKYGAALAQYDTVSTARDMDQLREAVGDAKLTYLGVSYGTELGGVYAHLFPRNIRAMVLDGAVDPLTDDVASATEQVAGFEQAFDQFAIWCRTDSTCRALGNPRTAVAAVAAAASRNDGIPSTAAGETRRATPALVYTGVLEAMYSRSLWAPLGRALLAARGGDSSGLLSLADEYNQRTDGRYTNIADANQTIGCNDSKPGPTDPQVLATARMWAKRFPLFGRPLASELLSCQPWQSHRTPVPLPTAPTTPNKILVVGNLHDPATPYQGAKNLTRTLGHAELLSWDGEGHTSYGQGSSCVDDYVDDYLIDLKLPPVDTTCPRK